MTLADIVSIPFWLFAAVFAVGSVACPCIRRPGETDTDLVMQGAGCLIVSGIFGIVALLVMKL